MPKSVRSKINQLHSFMHGLSKTGLDQKISHAVPKTAWFGPARKYPAYLLPRPIRMHYAVYIVQGQSSSHTFSLIVRKMIEVANYNGQRKQCLTMPPTGRAAYNNSSQTLNSADIGYQQITAQCWGHIVLVVVIYTLRPR